MTAPFGRRLCKVTESRASGGYHLFSLMQGESYNGVSQQEFIRTLVALTARR
jgi:hypothetical protein